MADVRSLLKTQRSSRQIRHPHAVYSSKGQLSCSLCRLLLKSESLWDQHLRSKQHTASLTKAQEERTVSAGANKKRKASSSDDEASTKRVRSDNRSKVVLQDPAVVEEEQPAESHDVDADAPVEQAEPSSDALIQPDARSDGVVTDEVDADEWAAFEAEIQSHEEAAQAAQRRQAYEAAPSITAKPLSAVELAAQDREERSKQKGEREQQLEDEREEAQEQMLEEFEQQDDIEARLSSLRERRKALLDARRLAQNQSDQPRMNDSTANDNADNEEVSEEDEGIDEWDFGR